MVCGGRRVDSFKEGVKAQDGGEQDRGPSSGVVHVEVTGPFGKNSFGDPLGQELKCSELKGRRWKQAWLAVRGEGPFAAPALELEPAGLCFRDFAPAVLSSSSVAAESLLGWLDSKWASSGAAVSDFVTRGLARPFSVTAGPASAVQSPAGQRLVGEWSSIAVTDL